MLHENGYLHLRDAGAAMTDGAGEAPLPQALLEIVRGAGHMLTMEQPAAVSRLLLDWLESIRPVA